MNRPVTDRELLRLGIWRIPVPTPFSKMEVNVYAVEDEEGGLALIDTGANSPMTDSALSEGLRRIGLGLRDLRRIIVTHGHADHYGLAQSIVDRAERHVPVFAHPDDIAAIDASGPLWAERIEQYAALFTRHGAPPEALADLASRTPNWDEQGRRVRDASFLRDGDVLRFRRFEATVLHLPGHTPGLVCLFDPVNRLLFSSDHVLEKTTPPLQIALARDGDGAIRPLVEYLESLQFTRSLDVRVVLPGHGAPFVGHRAAIDDIIATYDLRQARVEGELTGRSSTAYAVAEKLFPRTASAQLMPALFHTIAILEALEARGAVVRRTEGGTHVFRSVARLTG